MVDRIDDDARAAPEVPARRRGPALRRAGAALSGVALLAAAAGIVVAGDAWEVPAAGAAEVPRVAVPAGEVAAVCPGPPELTTGAGTGVDPELDPVDVTPTTLSQVLTLPRADAAAAEGTYGPLGGEAEALTHAGDVRRSLVEDPGEPGVLRAGPVEGRSALAAGATVSRTDAGDLRGLVAAPCQPPATSVWLVGGGTEVGQSAQLVLTNPGDTPATVTATMWTTIGVADAPRLAEIVVAPGETSAVLLESVATSDAALALRVEAAGGRVSASVQELRLDGIVPAGVDVVTPAAPPSTTVTVPGVVVTDDDAGASAVRLLNPGEEIATVSVELLGAEGPVELPGAQEVVLDPGAVLDLSLSGVEAGTYAVRAASERPVTAGVVLARTGTAGELDPDTPPRDRAWTAAAQPAAGGVVALPGLGTVVDGASVVLTNPGGDDLTAALVPVDADGRLGAATDVDVAAGSTVATDVADLGEDVVAVLVDGGPLVGAGVLTAKAADGELIAVVPLVSDPQAAGSVAVDVR